MMHFFPQMLDSGLMRKLQFELSGTFSTKSFLKLFVGHECKYLYGKQYMSSDIHRLRKTLFFILLNPIFITKCSVF